MNAINNHSHLCILVSDKLNSVSFYNTPLTSLSLIDTVGVPKITLEISQSVSG